MAGSPKKRAKKKAIIQTKLDAIVPNDHPVPEKITTVCPYCDRRVRPEDLQQRDPNKPTGKRSAAEVATRRKTVEEMLQEGFIGADLCNAVNKKMGANYPWVTLNKDIAFIRAKWEEEDTALRPILRGRQRRELYGMARNLKKEHPKSWIRLQQLIARIDGTEAPLQVEVKATDEFADWSTEELNHYGRTGEVPQRLFGDVDRG